MLTHIECADVRSKVEKNAALYNHAALIQSKLSTRSSQHAVSGDLLYSVNNRVLLGRMGAFSTPSQCGKRIWTSSLQGSSRVSSATRCDLDFAHQLQRYIAILQRLILLGLCLRDNGNAGHRTQRGTPSAAVQNVQPVFPLRMLVQVVPAVQQVKLSPLSVTLDVDAREQRTGCRDSIYCLTSVLQNSPVTCRYDASMQMKKR